MNVGGVIIPGTPKSHETRTVPIARFLCESLARACEGRRGTPSSSVTVWTTCASRTPDASGSRPLGLASPPSILTSRHSLFMTSDTAASLRVATGTNVKVIQRMLGHVSAAITLDTHADLFDNDLDVVADALDQARSSAVVGGMRANMPAQ